MPCKHFHERASAEICCHVILRHLYEAKTQSCRCHIRFGGRNCHLGGEHKIPQPTFDGKFQWQGDAGGGKQERHSEVPLEIRE